MDRLLVSTLLLLCVSPPTPLGDSARREKPVSVELQDPERADICDDGGYRVENDLGDEENWKCQQQSHFVVTNYYTTGHSECSNSTSEPEYKCMSEDLHYDMQPPSSGAFRPKPPKYGDYRYLPPQRWLNALNHGAVAFLYHPCARQEDVIALKHLARSCLWKHVITPYPGLTTDQPLALVTWGCVYRMLWVDTSKAKPWIRQHALKTENSIITTNGDYDKGLLEDATIVSTQEDTVICPNDEDKQRPADNPESTVTATTPTVTAAHSIAPLGSNSDSTTPTESESHSSAPTESESHSSAPEPTVSTPGNKNTSTASGSAPTTTSTETDLCRNRTAVNSDSISCSPTVITVLLSNHPGYIALILVASLALVVVVMVFVWKSGVCRSGNRRRAKYKSVSKFFPFSYSQGEGSQVAMPELGLPKALPAEREMLLNDSDEDEL